MVIFLVNESITLKNTSNSSYYAKKEKLKPSKVAVCYEGLKANL